MDLQAEGAAHVAADDAHAALGNVHVFGQQHLQHVRRLVRDMGRQLALASVPVGEDDSRLQRHARMASRLERGLDDRVRAVERHLRRVGRVGLAETQVVIELRVQDGRLRVEGAAHVGDRRKRLEIDNDECRGSLRLGTGARDDRDHGLARPAGPVHRQRVLRRRLHPLEMNELALPRRADLGQLLAREDTQDTLLGAGGLGVDLADPARGHGGCGRRQHEPCAAG